MGTDEANAKLAAVVDQKVMSALKGIRFGSVEVTIHDGKVVQIERRERVRLQRDDSCGQSERRSDS